MSTVALFVPCPLCCGTGEAPRMRGQLRAWDVCGAGGECPAPGCVGGMVPWRPAAGEPAEFLATRRMPELDAAYQPQSPLGDDAGAP